jgi:GMP synthase-like glutamine amidotransferase
MSEKFPSQYGHKDSVTKVPHASKIISTGSQCLFSGLLYGNKVYTFQFHPELSADDVRARLSHSPEYVPEGVSVNDSVRESPEASTLIQKFVETVVQETLDGTLPVGYIR